MTNQIENIQEIAEEIILNNDSFFNEMNEVIRSLLLENGFDTEKYTWEMNVEVKIFEAE